MSELLTEEAQEDYFQQARFAWENKVISSSTLHQRLRTLDDLRFADASYKPIWFHNQKRFEHSEAEHFQDEDKNSCYYSAEIWNTEIENHLKGKVFVTNTKEFTQLIINGWNFHKGDADPHPSVPHAHWSANNRIKLDAYLGYTYNVTKVIGRIKRNEIIEIWNDNGFRTFARGALEHFIIKNPNYNFRIGNPRKLPRKRNPV